MPNEDNSLPILAAQINTALTQGEHALQSSRVQAGFLLIEARTRIESTIRATRYGGSGVSLAGKSPFTVWCAESIKRSMRDINRCIALARAEDPEGAAEAERAKAREGMRRLRAENEAEAQPHDQLAAPAGTNVSPGDIEVESGHRYWGTPPVMMGALKKKFLPDGGEFFDPCPHPREDGYDGLTDTWGEATYCNPPFSGGVMAWVHKAIDEASRGKLVIIVLPLYQNHAVAELINAGAVCDQVCTPEWLSLEDGSSNPIPPTSRQPCGIFVFEPRPKGHRHIPLGANTRFHALSGGGSGGVDVKPASHTEWYTPAGLFVALGNPQFDLDPASPGAEFSKVPALRHITKAEDGLEAAWTGFIWLNPPFGKRNGLQDFCAKFIRHGNGIALIPSYISNVWWHNTVEKADAILFMRRIKFINGQPGDGDKPVGIVGVCMIAIGERGVEVLREGARNGLGSLLMVDRTIQVRGEAPAPMIFDDEDEPYDEAA